MCESKKINKCKDEHKGPNGREWFCGLLLGWEVYIAPKYNYRSSTGTRFSVVSGSGKISGVRKVMFNENRFLNFESGILRYFLEFC